MTHNESDVVARKRKPVNQPNGQPYILKPLLEDIRLAGDDVANDVHINCIEYWNENLYIGTSGSEILHFVSLPAEPSDISSGPTFIEASRLQPAGHGNEQTASEARGVKSITVLPGACRACVLCNGTVSFYTLPELSPAPNGREVQSCQWVGGIDQDNDETNHDAQEIMVANSRRITIVKVGDRIQGLKNIQFPGCVISARRDTIACVADSEQYALLDLEHQQKIPLFPISSAEDQHTTNVGRVEDLSVQETSLPARSSSLAQHGLPAGGTYNHGRSSSLGNFVTGLGKRQLSPRPDSAGRERLTSPDVPYRSRSPSQTPFENDNVSLKSPSELLPAQRASSPAPIPSIATIQPRNNATLLQPHILSLTPTEFLLTTGTTKNEPGVGMFVNVEGDVVRGTVDFEHYPESIVADRSSRRSASHGEQEQMTGLLYVLVRGSKNNGSGRDIQVFSLAPDPSDMTKSKYSISVHEESLHVDLQSTTSTVKHSFPEVANILKLVRIRVQQQDVSEADLSSSKSDDESTRDWEVKRNSEEALFAQTFSQAESQVLVWADNNLFCLSENPLILQLEARLQSIENSSDEGIVTRILEDLRNRDARTETDFLSFNYIRQKASLLMFTNLLSSQSAKLTTAAMKTAENLLVESSLDPRIVMLMLPMLKEEVIQGPQGIWLSLGIAGLFEEVLEIGMVPEAIQLDFWQMIKRYMATWQGKRGFGSITDEQYVFGSVDAALLRVLLHLEESLPRGSPAASSIRAKLNNVVDNWKGNFDRAIALLEKYRRFFALSRLYQSRRLARDVLATWKRVIDGEVDGVGELTPESALQQIRRYLVNIRDTTLVEEYTIWLAQENPDLAVEVLTDDKSRVKFQPPHVLQLLKKHAPGAVQHFLEYLVFNKGSTKYVDDLIGYYLDSVVSVLESSDAARDSVAQSYSTYRALEPPKPTYINFIRENAPTEPWWQSRLRLLQLLGGGNYASAAASPGTELTYSISTVLDRLAPFSSYLVSESIILDARQGRHREALRLLTHGLGDYDTAVRYCYFAGPQSSTPFPLDEAQLPSFQVQKDLFNSLFDEFLSLEDLHTRLERTSELLAKFAKWFDPVAVLTRIPDDWSLDLLSEFLLRTMRALRGEMLEAGVVKALSAAENLRKQAEFVEACEKMGARIEVEKAMETERNAADGIVS